MDEVKKILERIKMMNEEHDDTVTIFESYRLRTRYLKKKLRAVNPRNRWIIYNLLCSEREAYELEVLHKNTGKYILEHHGFYRIFYFMQFGAYRCDYFEMLKELSHEDYIRVLAEEKVDDLVPNRDECRYKGYPWPVKEINVSREDEELISKKIDQLKRDTKKEEELIGKERRRLKERKRKVFEDFLKRARVGTRQAGGDS